MRDWKDIALIGGVPGLTLGIFVAYGFLTVGAPVSKLANTDGFSADANRIADIAWWQNFFVAMAGLISLAGVVILYFYTKYTHDMRRP